MAHRILEVSIISADDLRDVRHLGKMHCFAIISMPPYVEYATQIDKPGGVNPIWNETFTFVVPEFELQKRDAKIRVEIFSSTTTTGQRFVGEAIIPLSEIVRSEGLGRPMEKQRRKYPVKTLDGTLQGEIHLAFLLGERMILDGKSGDGVRYPVWIGDQIPPQKPRKPSSDLSRDIYSPASPDSGVFPRPPIPEALESPPYRPAPPRPSPYPEDIPFPEPVKPPRPSTPQFPAARPPVTIYPEPTPPYKSSYPSQLPSTRPAPYQEPASPFSSAGSRPSSGRPESANTVFAGPVGRVLLTELITDSPYDRGYRNY